MGATIDDSDKDILCRLTSDQRLQIYNEEKHRINQVSPRVSKRTKLLISIYLLGCVLLYFGIPQSFLESIGTKQLIYKPERDIFTSLLWSIMQLIRPFLAIFICVIPLFLVFGWWGWGNALADYLRKVMNDDSE